MLVILQEETTGRMHNLGLYHIHVYKQCFDVCILSLVLLGRSHASHNLLFFHICGFQTSGKLAIVGLIATMIPI